MRLIQILTVCGVGFGSSLLLKMAVHDVLSEDNLPAIVTAWDTGSAKGQKADIVLCSSDLVSHLKGFQGEIVPIKDITNKNEIRDALLPVYHKVAQSLREEG